MPCSGARPWKGRKPCKAVAKLIDYIKASGKMAVIDADALYALSKLQA